MSNRVGLHCYIKGKVQGVWFRASTREKALELQLTGFARNLPDGRVEVLAYGETENIATLRAWLQHGPRLAEVSDVESEEVVWQIYDDFKVL